MRARKRLSMIATASLVASLMSVSQPVRAGDDALVLALCNYVAADDTKRIRKKLKENRVRLRDVYDGVLCNGSNLLKFAAEKNAQKAGKFIAKKLPKGVLAAPGPDGVVFLDWAKSEGHDSLIVAEVKKKI